MNFANLTPVRLGMVGAFLGKRYHVADRVVMAMTEGCHTYYWTEFNLVDLTGESATLVFEVSESGPEWKFFTAFEPENPISAEDAASKRVGDPLSLEGTDVRVTLVNKSRVCHIEGEGAEGEVVGDVDHYFNARGGGTMIVVSWSGEKVECFRGVDLAYSTVRTAFNLQANEPSGFGELLGAPDNDDSSGGWLKFAVALVALIVLAAGYSIWNSSEAPQAFVTIAAPPSPLRLGSTGLLDGKIYRVQAHQVIESAQVGLLCKRHEYQLTDAEGKPALLVYGWRPGAKDWVLFSQLLPATPMSPQEAAARRSGETVNVDGYRVPISNLFRWTVRLNESAESIDSATGSVMHGFSGQSGSTVVQVRWREDDIVFYAGKVLPPKDVAITFGLKQQGALNPYRP